MTITDSSMRARLLDPKAHRNLILTEDRHAVRPRRFIRVATLLFATSFLTVRAQCGTISSSDGDLRTDANYTSCGAACVLGAANSDGDYAVWSALVVPFQLAAASPVQIVTFSYGGGVNGQGAPIAPGGFEPYLSLFDAAGNFLASTYFGITCPPGANVNPANSQCYDVLLDAGTLAPGSYQVAISAYLNLSLAENTGSGSLADGFTGLGNLQPGEDLHYAFDIDIGGETQSAPEPATLTLLMIAAGTAWLARRSSASTYNSGEHKQ